MMTWKIAVLTLDLATVLMQAVLRHGPQYVGAFVDKTHKMFIFRLSHYQAFHNHTCGSAKQNELNREIFVDRPLHNNVLKNVFVHSRETISRSGPHTFDLRLDGRSR